MDMNTEYPTEEQYAEEFGLSEEDLRPEDGGEAHEEPEGGSQAIGSDTEGNETDEGENSSQGGSEGGEMPAEERHRQAAMRRQREEQERQAAEETARQAAKDAVFAEMFQGQTNPYTGKPILTEADYRSYQAEAARQERQEKLENAGLDEDVIRGIVDQQTAPMRQQLEAARMAQMKARAEAINQAAEAAKAAAIRNIQAEVPEIQSIEDIVAMPTGAEFNRLVTERHMSIEEAFYLANRKELASRGAKAARASALNASANRSHLGPVTNNGGKVPREVPRAVAEMYRELMPGASDDEISKAYNAEFD